MDTEGEKRKRIGKKELNQRGGGRSGSSKGLETGGYGCGYVLLDTRSLPFRQNYKPRHEHNIKYTEAPALRALYQIMSRVILLFVMSLFKSYVEITFHHEQR
jgi:hypothetical protein